MTSELTDSAFHPATSGKRPFAPSDLALLAKDAFGKHAHLLWSRRMPKGRRPGVSSYRVFMAVVFFSIVAIDAWSDQYLSSRFTDVIGPISIALWTLTLLGSSGVGPIAKIWNTFRR
jgi:hypothetical protein